VVALEDLPAGLEGDLMAGAAAAAGKRTRTSDFESARLLSELDKAGRVRGAVVPTVEEALKFVRAIEE
jgi:hypothetical protein